MENNKSDRILEIFMRALRGESISIKSLAAEYSVSAKSISRDISRIQNFLAEHRELMQSAELNYVHKDRAYVLNNEEFLKNKELFALVKVLLGSRTFSKNEVLTLIYKLKRFTTVSDRETLDHLIHKEMYHYHEVKSDCRSVIDNLWKLIQAIEARQVITITYRKMNHDEVKRKIKPVSILFSEYYFYLIASLANEKADKPRYFRIDRITAFTMHRDSFSLPSSAEFDEGNLREKNQFMFPGKTISVRFALSGPSVQAMLDRLPTAKVVEKTGSCSVIETEVDDGRGILMYLLSQGAWVKVLSPPYLVDAMQEEIQKMGSQYAR